MQVLLVLSLLQPAAPLDADSLLTVPAPAAVCEVHAATGQLQGQQLLDAIDHDMLQVSQGMHDAWLPLACLELTYPWGHGWESRSACRGAWCWPSL